MLLFVYTTTHKRFVIFTCRYFKLSWNTTSLSQWNCRNFSCSSITGDIYIHPNPSPVLRRNSRRENKPTRKSKLSCCSLNGRSVANKGRELISRLTYKPCDPVAITKTWLDKSIESSEISTRSFQVHRRDRTRHGGGILLACNIELGCVRRLDFETDCEIFWCEIIIASQGSKFLVGVFYRPPSSIVIPTSTVIITAVCSA